MEKVLNGERKAMVSRVQQKKEETQNQSSTQTKSATKDLIGFLIGTLGSISMAVAAGCVQAMQGSMPHFEVNGFRFVLTLLSTIIYFLFKRQLPKVKQKEIIALGFFCSLVIGFNFAIYACVTYLPLGVAASFIRMFAMFLTLLMARIVLGESITVLKITGVVIGSVGLILVCKPEWFSTEQINNTDMLGQHIWNSTEMHNYTLTQTRELRKNVEISITSFFAGPTIPSVIVNTESEIIGYILAFLTSACSATHHIVQKAKLSEVNSSTLVFWFSLIGTLLSFIISLIFEKEKMTLPPNMYHWLVLLGHGCGACFMSLALIYAQYIASAIVVALALSTQIFFFFIGQYLFMNDIFPVNGTWIEILGAVLSIISVSLVPVIQFILIKCHKKEKSLVDVEHPDPHQSDQGQVVTES